MYLMQNLIPETYNVFEKQILEGLYFFGYFAMHAPNIFGLMLLEAEFFFLTVVKPALMF